MERCNRIFRTEKYRRAIALIDEFEKDRIYCLHGFAHCADVARLMYITSLEKDLRIKKDVIYAAAMLHDIGRAEQYMNGSDHEIKSAELAEELLPECGFSEEEADLITDAILLHRDGGGRSPLAVLLAEADKKSRLCFTCRAAATCKWAEDERNMSIEI